MNVGQLLRLAAVVALVVAAVCLLWFEDADVRDLLALAFAGLAAWAGAELMEGR